MTDKHHLSGDGKTAQGLTPPRFLADSGNPKDVLPEVTEWEDRLKSLSIGRVKWANLWAVLPLILLTLVLVVVAAFSSGRPRWLVITLAAALLFNAALYGVARWTDSLAWFGAAVFLSVPLLGGLVEMVHTAQNLTLQPVAVIRTGDDIAMCGVYVTQTSTRLYMARLSPTLYKGRAINRTTGEMFWIPATQIDLVEIGKLVPRADLATDARRLAAQIYQDRAEQSEPSRPGTTTTTTTINPSTSKTTTKTNGTPPQPASSRLKPWPPKGELCTSAISRTSKARR
jgi:hypothetical protein